MYGMYFYKSEYCVKGEQSEHVWGKHEVSMVTLTCFFLDYLHLQMCLYFVINRLAYAGWYLCVIMMEVIATQIIENFSILRKIDR